MKSHLQFLALTSGVMLAACTGAFAADVFTLTSPAFKDGTMMAKKNAGAVATNPNCVGENVSPPLAWANPPAGTKSYALLMVDPEGRGGLGVIHWLAYNIPPDVNGFAEGETSKPSPKYVGGKGTAGQAHYMGPCTPAGAPHHYTFTLVATDLEPGALPAGLTYPELMAKLDGHAKGATGLIGLWQHP
ncbi:MAG TPA: YbhB/YbcL family Raf kinase inhibitor-like protein [Xanthobacteraceae bacterium]|nr:YbhB/YbcL family Raf kinase inhibitor-like protein [Xanthobacteraceae bacterium]